LKGNPEVTKTILQIVDNQIKENNPPETKLTLDRLIKEGHDKIYAKKLIGYCILTEMNRMIKANEMFDNERFIKNLNNLPKEAIE
jgi:hypothetical protein